MSTHPTRARYTPPILPRMAALYARVSSLAQGEDGKASLPTQLAALRKKATELGYVTCDEYTYVEKHTGEELYERPELSRLRDEAKRRPMAPFGLVLCYSVERLARQSAYIQIVLDEWERLGISLQFATEELENTPLGRAILNMRAYAGEVESERKRDRTHRSVLARVLSGKPIAGGKPTYGYAWEETRRADGRLTRDRLILDPVTAPIVQRIWALADAGQTQRQIAGLLTAENVPLPSGRLGVWDPSSIHYILHNVIYWGEPTALKRQSVPVEKSVRHLYKSGKRDVLRPVEEHIALPTSVAPALVSKEMAERIQERMRQNQALAARNNPDPDASILRGLTYCGVCGARMTVVNVTNRHGPQFRCNTGTRLLAQRVQRCRTGGNTIMAAKLDADVCEHLIRLFETPGQLESELAQAHRDAQEEHAGAAAPVDDLTSKISDAERRLANMRTMAELIDGRDQQEALAARMTLLGRDREVWVRELAGRAAVAARPKLKEEAILAFQQHLAAAHGNDMSSWAASLMRQLLLILDARVQVWPLGDVRAGTAPDRAVLHLNLPLSGPRHLALTRLLTEEHVSGGMAAVGVAVPAADSAEHAFRRSTIYR